MQNSGISFPVTRIILANESHTILLPNSWVDLYSQDILNKSVQS